MFRSKLYLDLENDLYFHLRIELYLHLNTDLFLYLHLNNISSVHFNNASHVHLNNVFEFIFRLIKHCYTIVYQQETKKIHSFYYSVVPQQTRQIM